MKTSIGPLFTPPSLRGTLQRPSQVGGANWGGAAFDPESGYLFVRATRNVGLNRVGKNDGSDPLVEVPHSNRIRGRWRGRQRQRPSAHISPHAVPTAIDLNKGELVWKVRLGKEIGNPKPPLVEGSRLARPLGSPNNRGGALVTSGGLVFIGGGDGYFYAFDTKTGKKSGGRKYRMRTRPIR